MKHYTRNAEPVRLRNRKKELVGYPEKPAITCSNFLFISFSVLMYIPEFTDYIKLAHPPPNDTYFGR